MVVRGRTGVTRDQVTAATAHEAPGDAHPLVVAVAAHGLEVRRTDDVGEAVANVLGTRRHTKLGSVIRVRAAQALNQAAFVRVRGSERQARRIEAA